MRVDSARMRRYVKDDLDLTSDDIDAMIEEGEPVKLRGPYIGGTGHWVRGADHWVRYNVPTYGGPTFVLPTPKTWWDDHQGIIC